MTPEFAVSTWSLHRTIGLNWWEGPGRAQSWGPGRIAMLDLPAALKAHGYGAMHLCHFHIESRARGWLEEFSAALDAADVTLSMLLIDDGDISDPVNARRDAEWIGGWIETAATLGARSARIIAGKQPPSPQTLETSAAALSGLTRGQGAGRAHRHRELTRSDTRPRRNYVSPRPRRPRSWPPRRLWKVEGAGQIPAPPNHPRPRDQYPCKGRFLPDGHGTRRTIASASPPARPQVTMDPLPSSMTALPMPNGKVSPPSAPSSRPTCLIVGRGTLRRPLRIGTTVPGVQKETSPRFYV